MPKVDAVATGLQMGVSIGTAASAVNMFVEVTSPALHAHISRVTISGQLITFDYAYPFQGAHYTNPGLSKRQWYAGLALEGFIANAASPTANLIDQKAVSWCFKAADAMIEFEQGQVEGEPPRVAGQEKTATVQSLKIDRANEHKKQARKVA
jgi:hypothetical protein